MLRSPIAAVVLGLCALTLACLVSSARAADPPPLWAGDKPVPKTDELSTIDDARFHVIKRREPEQDGYNWLHGVALAWHNGQLYVSYGHNRGAENTAGEEARGQVSRDGGRTWSDVFTIDTGDVPELAVSHGVFLSHGGRLWAFQGAFYGRMQRVHTRAYRLNEADGTWEKLGVVVGDGFWPMQEPLRMEDGNWIMAGLQVGNGYGGSDDPAAVAISHGDDFTKWDLVTIPKPADMEMWGESTVVVDGSSVLNISRYRRPEALVSLSDDFGRSWSMMQTGNLPMAASKPYAGTLSTGQHYLVATTTADGGNRRSPLTIAVSRPGEWSFRRIYEIRDAVHEGPGESGKGFRLSYPYAVEHDGKLYVGYSNDGGRGANRNSAELAVIPMESLTAE
ncbi:exo-alpha-sialidase [Maioricimonas rarisocia]|uniref:exo-alpha-sialidase n=1 Tax=Maioricimonas rarisocia TaxID=2528026 RepID=UPI0018D21A41|nr:exo-alpha-sialidase [Maioricimonas rarisocia]